MNELSAKSIEKEKVDASLADTEKKLEKANMELKTTSKTLALAIEEAVGNILADQLVEVEQKKKDLAGGTKESPNNRKKGDEDVGEERVASKGRGRKKRKKVDKDVGDETALPSPTTTSNKLNTLRPLRQCVLSYPTSLKSIPCLTSCPLNAASTPPRYPATGSDSQIDGCRCQG